MSKLRADIQRMTEHGVQAKQLELKIKMLEEQYRPIKEWIDAAEGAKFSEDLRAPASGFLEGAERFLASVPYGGALGELAGFARMGLQKKASAKNIKSP